jgi:hypothetical protein
MLLASVEFEETQVKLNSQIKYNLQFHPPLPKREKHYMTELNKVDQYECNKNAYIAFISTYVEAH